VNLARDIARHRNRVESNVIILDTDLDFNGDCVEEFNRPVVARIRIGTM